MFCYLELQSSKLLILRHLVINGKEKFASLTSCLLNRTTLYLNALAYYNFIGILTKLGFCTQINYRRLVKIITSVRLRINVYGNIEMNAIYLRSYETNYVIIFLFYYKRLKQYTYRYINKLFKSINRIGKMWLVICHRAMC